MFKGSLQWVEKVATANHFNGSDVLPRRCSSNSRKSYEILRSDKNDVLTSAISSCRFNQTISRRKRTRREEIVRLSLSLSLSAKKYEREARRGQR